MQAQRAVRQGHPGPGAQHSAAARGSHHAAARQFIAALVTAPVLPALAYPLLRQSGSSLHFDWPVSSARQRVGLDRLHGEDVRRHMGHNSQAERRTRVLNRAIQQLPDAENHTPRPPARTLPGYEALRTIAVPEAQLSNSCCPITLAGLGDIAQPIVVRTSHVWTLFDYQAFARHWLKHGTNPLTRQQVIADDIRQIAHH